MVPFNWEDLLTEQDRQVIQAAGYGERGASTFASRRGGDSPALLIIDMQHLFVGDDVPILEAIERAPSMIGAAAWRAAEHIVDLSAKCRRLGVPVIYARMLPADRSPDDPLLMIIPALQPQPADIVIDKTTSSAFFKTGLATHLHHLGCDSVILTGNSTSGCIRAAAVDALAHGFGAFVPVECVCDRIEASHKVALLDMWMKYATVLKTEDLILRMMIAISCRCMQIPEGWVL